MKEISQTEIDALNAKAQALYAQRTRGLSDKKWIELAVNCLKSVAKEAEFVTKDDVGDSFLFRRLSGVYVFCKVRGDVELQDESFQGYGFYLDSPPSTIGELENSEQKTAL